MICELNPNLKKDLTDAKADIQGIWTESCSWLRRTQGPASWVLGTLGRSVMVLVWGDRWELQELNGLDGRLPHPSP